jgi:hypothetical protein
LFLHFAGQEAEMAITTEEKAKSAADIISMGALIVAGGAVAAIVLTVIGLANIAITGMLAVATIVIGVTFILQGMEIMAEYSAAAEGNAPAAAAMPVGGGVTMELLVGGAGIVLGILALVAVNAMFLVPAAVILYGGALMLIGFTRSQAPLTSARLETAEGAVREMARQSNLVAAGAQVIVGISAIILGILAYVLPAFGHTMALVGLLAVGAALLLSSAAEASFAQVILGPARGRAGPAVRPTPGE